MIFVGIDNGISGGLAAIAGPKIVSALVMPTQKTRKGNEINASAVAAWLRSLPSKEIHVTIEEPGGSKSSKAATSMAGSFHTLRTICELLNLDYARITPQAWQRTMLPTRQTGQTKQAAAAVVVGLWSAYDFRATTRCKTPHDGLIDAALIAEYSRRLSLV